MPCDTKVLVTLENTPYNQKARKKLGLSLTGQLSQADADDVRIEAGKLKTIDAIMAIDPLAAITGTTVGSDTLTIQLELNDLNI